MKSRPGIFLMFLSFLIAQALLSNFINFGPLIYIALYPLFILTLPVNYPVYEKMILSFLLGLGVDYTGGFILGLNAGAAVCLSFFQPVVFKAIIRRGEIEHGIRPGLFELGPGRFISYIVAGLAIHHAAIILLENFSLTFSFHSLLRFLLSIFVNTLLILLTEFGIFYKNRG